MKRIFSFIFLGLITLNSNMFSLEHEQASVAEASQVQLSKMDWAQVGIASVGCLWFGMAAIMTYSTMNTHAGETSWKNIPTERMFFSFMKAADLLGYKPSNSVVDTAFITSGITSGILSCGLGAYVYKKLSTLRSNKLAQLKG